jgi:ATP-dependent RNA helicase DDX54/DBP10
MSSSDDDDAYPAAAADMSDEGSGSEDYASLMPQAPVKKSKSGGFESMNLFPPVFRAVRGKGYRVPTPIQRKAIPLAIAGRDIVAMARTGSGKTAAFLVPALHHLREHASRVGCRCVILSPTRELALQTIRFTRELSKFQNLRACLLVGGDSMGDQFAALSQNPDVIIATPGRLLHHLSEVESFSLALCEIVIFDEVHAPAPSVNTGFWC